MAELEPVTANSSLPEALSGTIAGRFLITQRLGKGGMGEVYRAEDTKLKRTVALKRLAPQLRTDPNSRRRFQQEAERVSRFSDAHVAALYDVLEEREDTFLVMEYVEGETLRQRLRRSLSLDDFFQIAIQCAEGLAAAHRQGIVHCDIKPENIMLSTSGQVKILDFGVARCLPRSGESTTLDRSGSTAGTPAYMSPEALLEKPPDARSDLFSLGVMFYELLTGLHPFLASSFVATTDRIRNETPAPIRIFNSKVSDELQGVVSKAMAKEPSQRYATAAEILQDLHAIRSGITSSSLLRILPAPKPIRRKSAAWRWALIMLVIVLGLFVTYRQLKFSGLWPGTGLHAPMQLAVLPFTSASDDPGVRAFCAGLTQTLTAKLTQLTGAYPLQVVPISEIGANKVSSVEQARRDFGVNLVLEGSLHNAGNQVRVNYTLVDAKTRRQLNAETVDVNAADAFAMEDRVVSGVIGMLGLEIHGNDRVVLAAHGTSDPTAHDQYLRGRGYLLDYHKPENIGSAISSFNRALTLDSKYAEAYAGLGEAYWLGYREGQGGKDWLEKARSACDHAVAQSALADGYACLGRIYRETGEYESAVTQFQKATTLDPTNDDAFRGLADVYQKLNRPADAEATYRRAIHLRPQYWGGYSWLGVFYFSRARYDDAAGMFKEVIALAPDNYRGYSNLGAMYVAEGHYQQGIEMLEKSATLRPTVDAYLNLGTTYFLMHNFSDAARSYREALKLDNTKWLSWGNLADALFWMPGKRQEAEDAYRQAIRLTGERLQVNPRDGYTLAFRATYLAMTDQKSEAMESLQKAVALSPTDPDVQFRAALVYNQVGDVNRTLDWLEKALAGGITPDFVLSTPDFDHLRSNTRFQKLVQKH